MPKPNEGKVLNFVARVYDPSAEEDPTYGKYRPIYIAPDATDKVQGDVKLSDAIDSELNAEEGMTAATPIAVKTVNDSLKTKLDKEQKESQIVKSEVTFNEGVVVPDGKYFTGNLDGNAKTATQLVKEVPFTVSGEGSQNTVKFDGTNEEVKLVIGNIDASKIKGTLPIGVIPQGALERVVSYVSIDAAITAWTSASENSKPFNTGDTIRVTGVTPNVMYAVVGEDPSRKESYVEYAAGTATNAINAELADEAVKLQTARTIITDLESSDAASFDGSQNITPGVTGTLPIENGGTGATTPEEALANLGASSSDHTHNYLPLSGGTLTGNLNSVQIAPTANNTYSLGTEQNQWSNVYAEHFRGTADSADVLNQSITVDGDVYGELSLKTPDDKILSLVLNNDCVGYAQLTKAIGIIHGGEEDPMQRNQVLMWISVPEHNVVHLDNVHVRTYSEDAGGSRWYDLLDLVYPVGSFYLSHNSTSPATLFGGSWARIPNDYYLRTLGSSADSFQGGTNSYELKIENLPSHNHTTDAASNGARSDWNIGVVAGGADHVNNPDAGDHFFAIPWGTGTGCADHNSKVGEGQALEITPQYQGVYCWYRTA